jgi:threonine/homoserine/homoserine lactone efflux protein
MLELQHLFLGWLTSFIGTLPVGIISLIVVEVSSMRGIRQGLGAAAGVSLVESVQTWLAVSLIAVLLHLPWLEKAIYLLSVPIFGFLAYQHLSSKGRVEAKDQIAHVRSGFRKGMMISSLNIVIFPYFFFIGGELIRQGRLIQEQYYIWLFAVGAGLGTLVAMAGYALLGVSLKAYLQKYNRWVNRFIGLLFLGIALLQLKKMIWP